MPLPKKGNKENKKDFLSRCMENETMNKEYPNQSQRYAVCNQRVKASLLEQVCDIIEENSLGNTEYIGKYNFILPEEKNYIDFGEDIEEMDFNSIAAFIYKNAQTDELFYFSSKANHQIEDVVLEYVSEAAEYQGRKVQLGKPFRTPDGPKKFSVYVKNDKGNVVKVNFGDPNMEIKKDDPARRRSFRARHNCDNPGPRWKARYWSCKAW
jgi:hypothetical protein